MLCVYAHPSKTEVSRNIHRQNGACTKSCPQTNYGPHGPCIKPDLWTDKTTWWLLSHCYMYFSYSHNLMRNQQMKSPNHRCAFKQGLTLWIHIFKKNVTLSTPLRVLVSLLNEILQSREFSSWQSAKIIRLRNVWWDPHRSVNVIFMTQRTPRALQCSPVRDDFSTWSQHRCHHWRHTGGDGRDSIPPLSQTVIVRPPS